MQQIISVLVENQAGVLNKITGLFSRRAFNIISLAVGVTQDPTISRISMIVDSNNAAIEQIEKQLNKLICVIKVKRVDESDLICKELMMIKVNANNKTRSEVKTLCDLFGGRIDDVSANTITIELAETSERLELFEKLLRPFGILEEVRTGTICLEKGNHYLSWSASEK